MTLIRALSVLCALITCLYGLGSYSFFVVGIGSVMYSIVGRQAWLPYALCGISFSWMATAADAWVCVGAACVLLLLTYFREHVAFA